MILPVTLNQIAGLGLDTATLITAIFERRHAIRANHRDQKGDDRCWLDDFPVWGFVEGLPSRPYVRSFEEGMRQCGLYYEHRRSDTIDPTPPDATIDPAHWDDDLSDMDHRMALEEISRIQWSIMMHFAIGGQPRTLIHDRALYGVLPEKIPADFRLPPRPEFLGRAKYPHAGCPAFWDSHGGCGLSSCDLHKWGQWKIPPPAGIS